jgi:hypothetical protein
LRTKTLPKTGSSLALRQRSRGGVKIFGDDYPFTIDDSGRAMCFVTPLTKAGSVYLFCLFLSHAYDRTIVSAADAPKVTNKTHDLFQACATVALEAMSRVRRCHLDGHTARWRYLFEGPAPGLQAVR